MILADKIMDLRRKAGWSQEQLGHELGVSRQTVSKWESGLSIPDLDKILKLSALFGVSTDYLLKDAMEAVIPADSSEDETVYRTVDIDEANAYMDTVARASKPIAAAVSLFILCPVPVILLTGFAELYATAAISEDVAAGIGVAALLAMIIVGVVLCILHGMKLSRYEYLEKEIITLQYGVEGIVRKKKESFAPQLRVHIALGVGLCIAGIIPLIITACMGCSDFVILCMVCLLLACIAVAVCFFITAGMVHDSCEKLLQEGDYTPSEKLSNKKIEPYVGIYWCVVTAVYLGISFYFDNWARSWIIWPVAGVLFVALAGILKVIVQKKKA